MSTPKEPQFFSFSDRYERGAQYHNSLFKQSRDIEYYGESSQCYMVHAHALERICKDLVSPRAILLLRHPVERLVSHYRWNYKLGAEKESLLRAIDERGEDTSYAPDQRVGMYRERGGYLAFSRYSKWVPLWREAVGTENLLLLRTEDLKADQAAVARKCFEFLGLAECRVETEVASNTTAETLRLVPKPVQTLARVLPAGVKKSAAVRRVVNAFRRSMTRDAPKTLSPRERQIVHDALETEIAYYDALPAVDTQ